MTLTHSPAARNASRVLPLLWLTILIGTLAHAETPVQVIPVKPPRGQSYLATADPALAAMQVAAPKYTNLLTNPHLQNAGDGMPAGWAPWGSGFQLLAAGGQSRGACALTARIEGDPERGIMQEVVVDQKVPKTLVLSGWSRAENVSGGANSDYSLYADLTYQDGSQQWGEYVPFSTGTHDWQRAEVVIAPERPIKSLKIYALFRGHTGKAWFSDLNLGVLTAPTGAALFDSLAVRMPKSSSNSAQVKSYRTGDGLELGLNPSTWQVASLKSGGRELADATVPSGFLMRDVANNSGYYPVANGQAAPLKLKLDATVQSKGDTLEISGSLADLTGQDRAVSLLFALPVNAHGWNWHHYVRESRRIEPNEEYSNSVAFGAGANGRASLYPLASIGDDKTALALAADMNAVAQYRLAYNAPTRQFYIAYDFGLTLEKPNAQFRFIIYRTDPQWEFRGAFDKYTRLFPAMFQLREANKQQGLWMPFTDVKQVQGWQDFGFRFREGDSEVANSETLGWDDRNGILTFRYREPMTWWMPMAHEIPRTYENALAQLQRIANDPADKQHDFAQAVLTSGFRDESGRYPVIFRNEPWANGAVWSLSVSPGLPGQTTGATLAWSDKIRDTIYRNNPHGELDGEYLDSLEGYVTSNLNYDRDHFTHAGTPLTFTTDTKKPVQHKALLVYELVRKQSEGVHGIGKMLFANSVPRNYSFLMPWLDVAGTESNWLPGGTWIPENDAVMSLRRTMSGPKPYLLLQNTNYEQFSAEYVEKYMQRSLFYGMFPGFFSADAATNPYWLNPKWYNRDRPLFKKYLPIIRPVAEAGWQPLTLAKSNNPDVWLERFGQPDGAVYLTVRNNSATAQTAVISLQPALKPSATVTDLVSGTNYPVMESNLTIPLQPDQTMALRIH